MDCSPPDSSVQGILQARILECIVMPSSLGHLPYTGIKPASSINFFLVWYKTALFKNHTLLFFFFYPKNGTHLFKSSTFSTGILIPYRIPLYYSTLIINCYSTQSSLSSDKIKTNSKRAIHNSKKS